MCVSYLRSYTAKKARHQNSACGGEHTTQPPHTRGGVYPGAWTGVVLWTRPLHLHVRYSPYSFPSPLVFQGPTWVPLLQAIKTKRLLRSESHWKSTPALSRGLFVRWLVQTDCNKCESPVSTQCGLARPTLRLLSC